MVTTDVVLPPVVVVCVDFFVEQHADQWKLLVDKTGPATAQAALLAGPSVITIQADGQWTIN